jgi:UDP-N-acetylmuramate: L-alanyl-gamma-D-glutamyl-meso-diaminopimelate ligase
LDEVKTAFKRLVNLIPKRGLLVAWDGHPNVDECIDRAFCRVERYGLDANSTWRVSDIRYEEGATRWRVWRNGNPWADFESQLAGEYKVLNGTARRNAAGNWRFNQCDYAWASVVSSVGRLEFELSCRA